MFTLLLGKYQASDDKGATALEYGLLVALIALVIAVGAALLGPAISDLFEGAADQVVAP